MRYSDLSLEQELEFSVKLAEVVDGVGRNYIFDCFPDCLSLSPEKLQLPVDLEAESVDDLVKVYAPLACRKWMPFLYSEKSV